MKRIIFIIVGCLALGLGTLGVILPILPTVPFYMITLFCFANSSDRLHNWFVSTSLYKNHLESFVTNKSMSLKTKLLIMSMVTILMAIGAYCMFRKGIYFPCFLLGFVWLFHIFYFGWKVKTV